MFIKLNRKGFTLVELLIVIALISILSVAVLATINPIEQSNKARDAKFKNDAAEFLGEATNLTFIDVVLGTRKSFGNAAASGLSVVELKPKDSKAIAEIETLFKYVFNVK